MARLSRRPANTNSSLAPPREPGCTSHTCSSKSRMSAGCRGAGKKCVYHHPLKTVPGVHKAVQQKKSMQRATHKTHVGTCSCIGWWEGKVAEMGGQARSARAIATCFRPQTPEPPHPPGSPAAPRPWTAAAGGACCSEAPPWQHPLHLHPLQLPRCRLRPLQRAWPPGLSRPGPWQPWQARAQSWSAGWA